MSFRRGRRPPFSASACLADASRRERPFVFKPSRKLSRRKPSLSSFFAPRRLLIWLGWLWLKCTPGLSQRLVPEVSLGIFLEKVLIFFQFLELSPERPVCWFLRQGGLYLEIPPHRFKCMLSNNFARASLVLGFWPVDCDFTRRFIDDEVVRVGVNIRRVKALAFVFSENRSVLFYVLGRKLQNPERFLSPRAFGPRNHLQKLASGLGISLRGSSKHRSK